MAVVISPARVFEDRGIGVGDVDAILTAANSNYGTVRFKNTGDLILVVKNGSASPVTVTLKSAPDSTGRGGEVAGTFDEPITIAAGDTGFFPFMSPAMFNSEGLVEVTLSATTTILIGIVRLRQRR